MPHSMLPHGWHSMDGGGMGFTIGVVGASGGLGASTLTAALAARALIGIEGCDRAVIIDADVRGGLDTTACLEHVPGHRWEDLGDGSMGFVGWSGSVRFEDLPAEEGLGVIAARRGPVPDPALVAGVIDALSESIDLLAVDCGPRPTAALLSRLDLLVVLAGTTARGLGDATALTQACTLTRSYPVLVTRGTPRDQSGPAAARHLGLPLLGHLPDDARIRRHAEQGISPGTVCSALDELADRALEMAQSRWLAMLMASVDDAPALRSAS